MTDWTEESAQSNSWTEENKNPPKARPADGDWSLPNFDDPYLFMDYDFSPWTTRETDKDTTWTEES